jgi:hypothetical protein
VVGVAIQTANTTRVTGKSGLGKTAKISWENNYGTTLPPLGAFHRQRGLGCYGGSPLWQNTIAYKWLGAGEVLDGCMCLRSCRLTGGFGPAGCGPDDFKKRDAAAMSGNTLFKGDPSGIG